MPVLELFALTKPEPSSAGRILAVNHVSDFRAAEIHLRSKNHRQPKSSQGPANSAIRTAASALTLQLLESLVAKDIDHPRDLLPDGSNVVLKLRGHRSGAAVLPTTVTVTSSASRACWAAFSLAVEFDHSHLGLTLGVAP